MLSHLIFVISDECEESEHSSSAGVLACEFRHWPGARNDGQFIAPLDVWRRDAAATRSRGGCATLE
jgi:hypothetical protein